MSRLIPISFSIFLSFGFSYNALYAMTHYRNMQNILDEINTTAGLNEISYCDIGFASLLAQPLTNKAEKNRYTSNIVSRFFTCKKCNPQKKFDTRKSYDHHLYKEHPQPQICNRCTPKQLFPNKKEYQKHCNESHYSKELMIPHTCYKCVPAHKFYNQSTYKAHYNKVHRNKKNLESKPHVCKKCDPEQTFPNQKTYDKHRYRKHLKRNRKNSNTTSSIEINVNEDSGSSLQTDQHASKESISQEEIEKFLSGILSIPDDIAESLQL